MAIISTFDPKFKNQIYQKSVNEYWKDDVVLIMKSKLFLWTHIILPFIWRLITLATLITLIVLFLWEFVWLSSILIILVFITRLYPGSKILKYTLDYYMDFSIVTPQSFIRYDQTWFFKRTSKTIDLTHIRSVYVKKAWFRNSIFNNWNIVILSEWSDLVSEWDIKSSPWEVMFRYVKNPEYYSEQIEKLLKKINQKDEVENYQ